MDERYPLRAVPGYAASRPGIQIGTQLRHDASEEEILMRLQLGVEWVMTDLPRDAEHSAASYRRVVERFASYGLRVYRLANHNVHNMPAVTLNLPDRDAKIAEYLGYLRDLAEAGIFYATYAHMGNGIWSTERERIRGGATSRAFRLERATEGHWVGEVFRTPLSHGRAYTVDELWDNYAYFIERVAPVADSLGMRIGIHPDDPPVYTLAGIPRPIFGTFAGYRRALEMADSPNIGMCLCVGCWLEGGPSMGRDVVETIRYFGGLGKLFKVHLRNVTAPMPEGFVETYLDDGYMDMVAVVGALQEVGFDGALISDHLPEMAGGRTAAEAFSLGYMKGLVQAVTRAGRA
ncbi:MAG: mannonate dehydratase [Anaerolineae bacterium]|jgi:mannonate dehydratase